MGMRRGRPGERPGARGALHQRSRGEAVQRRVTPSHRIDQCHALIYVRYGNSVSRVTGTWNMLTHSAMSKKQSGTPAPRRRWVHLARSTSHHVMVTVAMCLVTLGAVTGHRHGPKRCHLHVCSPILVSLLTSGRHVRLRGRDDLIAGRLVIDGDGDTTRGNAVRRLDPALAVSWTILHTLQYM